MKVHLKATYMKTCAVALAAGMAGVWLGSGGLEIRANAAGMSPVERMVAENEITQQIALYTLMVDGDGTPKPEVRTWAEKAFTKDAVFENYTSEGKLGIRRSGLEDIVQRSKQEAPFPADVSNRHYNVATYFDEVTPTTAKLRTVSMVITLTKGKPTGCTGLSDEACGGRVVRARTFTYHDTFTKTPEGWKKSHSILRSDQ